MVDERLRIIIEVTDKASKEMSKVSKTLGSLGKVVGTAALGALAVGATAAAGAALSLGKALQYSVEQAMEAEIVTAQLNAVLKSTGGIAGVTARMADDLATSLSQVTRYDDEAILSAENLMLTFTAVGKDVFPEAIKASLDMSTAVGQDLQSSVTMLGKALQSPVDGLTALKRVGVNVTDEFISQIKAIMGDNEALENMAKKAGKAKDSLPGLYRDLEVATTKMNEMRAAGKSSESQLLAQQDRITTLNEKIAASNLLMDGYAKAQEAAQSGLTETERLEQAQILILEELKTEFGGSAEAAGQTFAGQLDILRNTLNNVSETIGESVMPTLADLANELLTFVQSDEFQDWVKEVAEWLRNELPRAIKTTSDFWTNELKPALDEVWPVLRDDLLPVLKDLADLLGPVFSVVMKLFIEGWKIQIGLFSIVKTAVENTINPLKNLWEWLKKIVEQLGSLVLPDWLTPGSPTPFELGLRGITDAMGEMGGLPGFGIGGPSTALRSAQGAGMVVVNFNSPVLGFADEYALADKLAAILRRKGAL